MIHPIYSFVTSETNYCRVLNLTLAFSSTRNSLRFRKSQPNIGITNFGYRSQSPLSIVAIMVTSTVRYSTNRLITGTPLGTRVLVSYIKELPTSPQLPSWFITRVPVTPIGGTPRCVKKVTYSTDCTHDVQPPQKTGGGKRRNLW